MHKNKCDKGHDSFTAQRRQTNSGIKEEPRLSTTFAQMNQKFFGLLLSMLSNQATVEAYSAVKWFHLQVNRSIYNQTSKPWVAYIDSYLNWTTPQILVGSSATNPNYFLKSQLKFVKYFIAYDSADLYFLQMKAKHSVRNDKSLISVQKASGHLILSKNVFCTYCCYPKETYEFEWLFILPHTTTMNLSFVTLSFSSGSLNFEGGALSCSLGNFAIYDTKERVSLTLRGEHSFFDCYPNLSKFTMGIYVYSSTTFSINVNFSVIGLNLLQSNHTEQSVGMIPIHSYTLDEYTIAIWHIVIQKLKRLVIRVKPNESHRINIYDGPNMFSGVLSSNENVYKCATHQSMVFTGSNKLDVTLYLSFSSIPADIQEYHVDHNDNILHNLHSDNFEQSVDIHKIVAEPPLELSIQVVSFRYSGPESVSCLFGGFTTATFEKKNYVENAILCKNSTNEKNRFFYSSNSVILLILYWYKNQSFVDVGFKVKSTQCKVGHYSPCQISRDIYSQQFLF